MRVRLHTLAALALGAAGAAAGGVAESALVRAEAALGDRAPAVSPQPAPPPPQRDAAGNPIRRAPTGHVSNYDEAKVGAYTLPDPLVLQDGRPVRNADTWLKARRPEILRLYETHIYGRVPERAPKATFEVLESDSSAMDGAAIRKHVVLRFGGADGPKVNLAVHLPSRATAPVPVLLHLTFGPPAGLTLPQPPTGASAASGQARPRPNESGPIADILARGYGYAAVRYTEIQPDSRTTYESGVLRLALARGQDKPAADEWGTITAWAWGASRVLDYLATDKRRRCPAGCH